MTGLHDDRCNVTLKRGECNCPSAAFAKPQLPWAYQDWSYEAAKVERAKRLYHEEAAGYRGPSLRWLSVKADVTNWFRRLLRW
jgi:hypothetical protein